MYRRKCLTLITFVLALATLAWGVGQAVAQTPNQLLRQEANQYIKQAIEERHKLDPNFPPPMPEYLIKTPVTPLQAMVGYNPVVTYTLPNFAYSPNIRKFVDTLPGLGFVNRNALQQYIPVAVPDTATYPGADYYEISVNQYNEQLHPDLPAAGTILRGYKQTNTADANVSVNKYLGPLIIAKTYDPSKPAGVAGNGKPVRLLFRNQLPLSPNDKIPLPVDPTVMGAGMGALTSIGQPCDPAIQICANYSQNRVAIHLHGGNTPWISDGTPHQWNTPALDATVYQKGVSFQNVPDMVTNGTSPCAATGNPAACITPAPGDGKGTLYYTNQQSGRLMFYHDHAYGITRLNVYDGMAAGYLLIDNTEIGLIDSGVLPNQAGVDLTPALPSSPLSAAGGIYAFGIPLVIQDKTFVNDATTLPPSTVAAYAATGFKPTLLTSAVDPLWYGLGRVNTTGGNLWFPHEYMPNEDIYNIYNQVPPSGFNIKGRWDYGPWMAPPLPPANITLPSPTIVAEAFQDTMIINGHPYPYVTLNPTAYRFRILNACNDRILNLQLYYGAVAPAYVTFGGPGTGAVATTTVSGGVVTGITLLTGGTGYTSAPVVIITDANGHVATTAATATATVSGGAVTGLTLAAPNFGGAGYIAGTICRATAGSLPAGVTQGMCTEVSMVPASPNPAFPTWPSDGRAGGVPDPTTAGPNIIQIANEGGLLPHVAVIPAQPIDFEYNRRAITVLDVTSQSLLMGPANRADIITDFSGVPIGSVLIVYNDSPAPMPLFDPRNDLFSGDPDQSATGSNIGGPPSTAPGFGPNNRTIMQIRINPAGVPTAAFNLAQLQTALPIAYGATQPKPIVPQKAYDAAFGTVTLNDIMAGVIDDSLNLTGVGQPVSKIFTTLPGQNYTTAPAVQFAGGGCVVYPTATATLNGVTVVTVLTAGTGYTSLPTVTFTPAPGDLGTGAQAIATIQGGLVIAITVTVPGSNYLVAPTVTLTGGTAGTVATAQASLVPGSVGTITLNTGGSGCTSSPQVFLTGGGGASAGATALLNGGTPLRAVGITEGFDLWYGRMNAQLGTTPTLLLPNVPAPAVAGIASYMDPPSDILNNGEVQIWRVSHIGADSHFVHWHLFNLQVVNRVDWTNSLIPPDANELGWKETVRTNPFTDLIVAFSPKNQVLPFKLPQSNRLLDPTTPVGSTMNFAPVAPAPGAPVAAQISNVMTNFGFEYVWHCHLLGHEENDMMRPLVLNPLADSNIGIFRNGLWALDLNGNGSWDGTPTDALYTFGQAGDIPVTGDWNGSGTTKIGYFRITGGVGSFYLDWNGNGVWDGPVIDKVYTFGQTGDIPVTGDWTGTGTTKIGVFRITGGVGMFYLDWNGNGVWDGTPTDALYTFGLAGDIPVTGDWNGSGTTKIGVFRIMSGVGKWFLEMNGNGVWNYPGDSVFTFGQAGDIPVTGDWNGDGTTNIGIFRNGRWFLDMTGNGVWNYPGDAIFTFGQAGDNPVTGKW